MAPTNTASVDASESGFTGTFSAQTSDATVATVTADGAVLFTVTAVAPGTCTITVSDGNGHSAPVSVSVQTTIIGGQ